MRVFIIRENKEWEMYMKNRVLLNVICMILVLIFGVFVSFGLMVVIYSLPTYSVEKNVEQSLDIFEREGDYYDIFPGNIGSRLDNFTDIYFMQMCFIKGSDNSIDNALSSYGLDYTSKDCSPTKDLIAYFNGTKKEIIPRETRFWNGYVIILKPMLRFFNYSQIRMINLSLQIILMCAVILLIHKKLGFGYVIPVILTWISLNPVVVSLNIFYSTIVFSTFIPVLIMLVFNDKIEKYNLYYLFVMLVGMETTLFNMNSSIAMPGAICIIMYYMLNLKKITDFKTSIKKMSLLAFSWLLGALGMWASNWILSSLFTDNYSLWQAFTTAQERTSTRGWMTRPWAIRRNWETLWSDSGWRMCAYIFGLSVIIYLIILMARKNIDVKKFNRKNLLDLFWLVIFSLIPFCWYWFMPSHSCIHAHFTYRTFSIGILASTYIPIYILKAIRIEGGSNEKQLRNIDNYALLK